MNAALAFRLSAVLGFLAVALGAFGAHGLKDLLEEHDRLATWETAVLYHLTHVLVLAAVAARQPFIQSIWWCFLAGILIFSGSLYLLCLTQVTALGAITPLGGLALLAGWVLLAIKGARG